MNVVTAVKRQIRGEIKILKSTIDGSQSPIFQNAPNMLSIFRLTLYIVELVVVKVLV